jgi:Pyruvate kinase, barrel domain
LLYWLKVQCSDDSVVGEMYETVLRKHTFNKCSENQPKKMRAFANPTCTYGQADFWLVLTQRRNIAVGLPLQRICVLQYQRKKRLRLKSVDDKTLKCEVEFGGMLCSKKGCNLPQTATDLPAVGDKDAEDLVFGVENGVRKTFYFF